MKPTTIDLCSVSYHANSIADGADAVYWLERSGETGSSSHLRGEILKSLHKIAAYYDLELVEAKAPADAGQTEE